MEAKNLLVGTFKKHNKQNKIKKNQGFAHDIIYLIGRGLKRQKLFVIASIYNFYKILIKFNIE